MRNELCFADFTDDLDVCGAPSTSDSDSSTVITVAGIIGMVIGIGIVVAVIGVCVYVAMKNNQSRGRVRHHDGGFMTSAAPDHSVPPPLGHPTSFSYAGGGTYPPTAVPGGNMAAYPPGDPAYPPGNPVYPPAYSKPDVPPPAYTQFAKSRY